MCLCNFHYPLSGIKVKIVMFHLSLYHLNHPILPYSKYSENNVRVRSCLCIFRMRKCPIFQDASHSFADGKII